MTATIKLIDAERILYSFVTGRLTRTNALAALSKLGFAVRLDEDVTFSVVELTDVSTGYVTDVAI